MPPLCGGVAAHTADFEFSRNQLTGTVVNLHAPLLMFVIISALARGVITLVGSRDNHAAICPPPPATNAYPRLVGGWVVCSCVPLLRVATNDGMVVKK